MSSVLSLVTIPRMKMAIMLGREPLTAYKFDNSLLYHRYLSKNRLFYGPLIVLQSCDIALLIAYMNGSSSQIVKFQQSVSDY
jgi:hypothetical protein